MAIRGRSINRVFSVLYFVGLFYVVFGIRIYPIFYFRVSHGYNFNILKSFPDLNNVHYGINLFSKYDWWLNILMFIGFPISLKNIWTEISLGKILLVGFITSFLIELFQYLFDLGVADINDLISNSIGIIIGICFLLSRYILKEIKKEKVN